MSRKLSPTQEKVYARIRRGEVLHLSGGLEPMAFFHPLDTVNIKTALALESAGLIKRHETQRTGWVFKPASPHQGEPHE